MRMETIHMYCFKNVIARTMADQFSESFDNNTDIGSYSCTNAALSLSHALAPVLDRAAFTIAFREIVVWFRHVV